MEEEYLMSLNEKEKLALSISQKMLNIQVKDTIGYKKFVQQRKRQQEEEQDDVMNKKRKRIE